MGELHCWPIEIPWLRNNLTFNMIRRGLIMAIRLNPKQVVPFEKLLISQGIPLEPIAKLPLGRRIFTHTSQADILTNRA